MKHVLLPASIVLRFFVALVGAALRLQAESSTSTSCDDNTKALEARLAAAESQMLGFRHELETQSRTIMEMAKLAAQRDVHLATLLNLVVHGPGGASVEASTQMPNQTNAWPGRCPYGTMPVTARVKPAYDLCVQIQPHVVDSTVTAFGNWGVGPEIAIWIFVAGVLLYQSEKWDGLGEVIFVDVGANIGTIAAYLAVLRDCIYELVVDEALSASLNMLSHMQIVAIEPDGLHASMLNATMSLNHVLDGVTIVQRAAWHTSDMQIVYKRYEFLNSGLGFVRDKTDSEHGASPMDIEEEIVKSFPQSEHFIQTTSLDDLLHLEQHKHFVLKIDAQGSELQVLRGAERLFREKRVILVHMEIGLGPARGPTGGCASLLDFLHSHDLVPLCGIGCADKVPEFAWASIPSDQTGRFEALLGHQETDIIALPMRPEDAAYVRHLYFTLHDFHWKANIRRHTQLRSA